MELESKTYYIIYCVSQFAQRFGISLKQSYAYLKRHKGLDFCMNVMERSIFFL